MTQENVIKIKKIKTWNEFKKFVDQLSDNWLFRGQSDAAWNLKSSLERTNFYKKHENVELNFITEFQRGAKNYLDPKEIPENLLEWVALMQHHGAPTRLLDFTKSAYVAAYFAFENANAESDIAIWAINIKVVRERAIEHLGLVHNPKFEEARRNFSDQLFEGTARELEEEDIENLFIGNKSYSCIVPVEPFQMNVRYSIQQSVFICPANSYETFMEQMAFLETDTSKTVIKIILSSKLKNEILRDLNKMNINRATLFPGIDGYSMCLKMKYSIQKTNLESLQNQLKILNNKKIQIYP